MPVILSLYYLNKEHEQNSTTNFSGNIPTCHYSI